MRTAIAAIPDAYIMLAMRNDAWFAFVSLLAMVIAGLQAFERAMIRLIERLVIWPFVQIRRTVYYSDSLMVEYFSATSAMLTAAWTMWGRDDPVAHHFMTARIPESFWIASSVLLSIGQFYSAAHGTITNRAVACVFACGFWSILSLVLLLRVGFSLAHVFSLPMALACWLAVFILIAKGQPHGPSTTAE